ncbi:hypothetical protein CP960_09150 [Malaciobacter halophilus]|uniref:Phosphate-starvation-inducible E-like protein n=1 Tax=Malaciobacter halophilus TaxID=197482 RepID=A0A2N1J1S9_9BACT|nr:phosphate-starvation-inducible PsiE family protein [Malaciobacter halophilus]AXH08596.1 putative membrane protein [Malaciobacter halophilus]PKI80442.1 hypothetical protein CP960_09150 [Malaciobacter halophilus]
MRKAIQRIKNYFENNYEFLAAGIIFIIILAANLEFQKIIVLMLEFIVIMEVMKMISDFIKKAKLRLRFVIDIFIIFLIRDVIIYTSHAKKDYFTIIFLLFVILIFFIFRILAIKYSPGKKEIILKEESNEK